jgi:hypothetical protein
MEWLRAIYEALGSRHPIGSLVVVILLGGAAAGGVWLIAANQYEKGLKKNGQVTTPAAGPISTDAPCSPVTQGSGNTVTATCEGSTSKEVPPKAPKKDQK